MMKPIVLPFRLARRGVGAAIALSFLFGTAMVGAAIQVQVKRSIVIRQMTGQVSYRSGNRTQGAAVGTQLQKVGDSLQTGPRSSATLSVDTDIGFIKMAEKTNLQVQTLRSTPDGGKITQLQVTAGQARLQLRPFTHTSSRLQVKTPAGVSGVRGTEFGVGVQASGKTGVATLTGSVVTEAQGRSVVVSAGTQNLTLPGEPPTPAVPLRDDPSMQLDYVYPISGQTVSLRGRTDPVNVVAVNGQPQTSDRNGAFAAIAPILPDQKVRVLITTPLGKQQEYVFDRPR